jgi:hypothetical protein
MTQEHPIVPPKLLVEEWVNDYWAKRPQEGYNRYIATRAAQWGKDQGKEEIKRERQEAADQELEACCQVLYDRYDSVRHATGFPGSDMSDWLRAVRRPKPPSLKEQALEIVRGTPANSAGLYSYEHIEIIRRALEQLPDNE